VKPNLFACMLSERVRLKGNIGRISFYPTTRYFQVIQLRYWVVLSGRKTTWHAEAAKCFDDSELTAKVGSMPAAYPADTNNSHLRSFQQCNHSEVLW